MLYSSSRTSLKDGLGKALFVDDYFFSDAVRFAGGVVWCGVFVLANDIGISCVTLCLHIVGLSE